MKARKRKSKFRFSTLFSLFIFAIVILLLFGISYLLRNKNASQRIAQDSLQIDYFTPKNNPTPTTGITPTPTRGVIIPKSTPTPPLQATCGIAGSSQIFVNIEGTCCIEDGPKRQNEACCSNLPIAYSYYDPNLRETIDWCNAKPIIYLYPEKPTYVDVELSLPGKLTVSIPEYPKGGWKNVLAYPDGTLFYNKNIYRELFYESLVTPTDTPEKGFVVESKNLSVFIKDFTMKLGLNDWESNEFLEYWIPKLSTTKSPYFFVSVFDQSTKDTIDKVRIQPQPDTFIQMIIYFKPLKENKTVAPLSISETPPRRGFTAVEWGGIIDNN